MKNKKIKRISGSTLTIGLHALMQNRVFKLVSTVAPEKIKLTPEEMAEWRKRIDYEDDAARTVVASEDTAKLNHIDHARSRALTSLFGDIRQGIKSIKAEKHQAGVRLKLIVDTYKNIQRENTTLQTQTVKGLLIDLEKPELVPHIAALDLRYAIDVLKAKNEEFEMIFSRRADSKKLHVINKSRDVRKENDEMIEKVYSHIEASLIYAANEADQHLISDLIDGLNLVSNEIKHTRNDFIAQRKSAKKRKNKNPEGKEPEKKPDEKQKPGREEDPGEDKI